jgi:hypothetical protein
VADFFEVEARADGGHLASKLDFPVGTCVPQSMCVMHPAPMPGGDERWMIVALLAGDPQYWVRLKGGPFETAEECADAIREMAGLAG